MNLLLGLTNSKFIMISKHMIWKSSRSLN